MNTNMELSVIHALRSGAKWTARLVSSLALMLALSAQGADAPRLPHQPVPQQVLDDAVDVAGPKSLPVPALPPAKAARSTLFSPATGMVPAWTALGPTPIPNGQTDGRSDPVSGRVTAIEIHPTNPNILYVGTAQGGVYRSLNGGTNWTAIFDEADSLAIGALALAPSSLTTLYVGTGEANGCGDCYAGVGLYRVDNAETTADLVGPINPVRNYVDGSSNAQSVPVFQGRSIARIVVHPTQPGTVFVGTAGGVIGMGASAPLGGSVPPLSQRGLWRSLNANGPLASITFDRIKVSISAGGFDIPNTGNRNINDIVMDPTDASGNTLVVWQNGVSTAGDGGVWRSVNAMAADPTTVAFVQTFATTATSTSNGRAVFAYYQEGANPTVIYVASGEPSSGTSCGTASQVGAVRRSIDGGATWSAKLLGGGGFAGGQAFYNLGLAVSPGATTATTDDIVHIGGNVPSASCARLHALSTDGGATFVNHDDGLHADTHAIAIAPSNPNIVFHGNDGGIWKSTDGGLTWTSLNNTQFSAMQFESIALHPTDRNFMIGGTQDNGTEMMKPDGTWTRADFGDGGFALIDQNATDTTNVTMYHTYFNQTGSLIGFARVTNVADAHDGGWSTFGGGLVSDDADDPDAETTEAIANGIGLGDTVLFYAPMTLGPGNPNTLYFGTDRLYRSSDRGAHMAVVSQAPLVSGNPISAIGISPQNDNVRIVGLVNGKVFATTTGSSTMTDVTGPIPARFVGRAIIDPNHTNTAYVALGGDRLAAGEHIWKTTTLSAGGGGWVASGTGIPDVPVNALVVDPSDSLRVYAGTDIGVYASEDGGATWSVFGTGFPRVAVFGLAIQNTHRVIRAATHGRGIYEIAAPGTFVPHALVTLGSRTLSGGNGNGFIDFNECNNLSITLNNAGNGPATGVSATLSSMTAGVTIKQPTSAYADIAASASGANLTPFKIETSPAFVCGTPIDCVLTVVTTSDGTFTFPFQLPSGSGVGAATAFDSTDVTKTIPTVGTINSVNTVSGLSGAIGKVTLSVYLTHTWDADLVLSLIAPDGTAVVLSINHGSDMDNYGTSCSTRTVFDDAAATAIGSASPPFAGTFRPDQALSAFNGLSPAVANGTWTLRIQDVEAPDGGTLQCWSLSISPVTCTDGGGPCPTAPVIVCAGDISTTNDLGQCSASVSFTNTVTGVPTPDVVCLLSNSVITSPHTFAVGTNLVICTATNVAGTNSCMFTVIVRDVTAPVITCPANIFITVASGVTSTNVTYAVSAMDNCTVAPTVCVPASGAPFPIGTNTVTCTATDASGNTNTCSFSVTVATPGCPPFITVTTTNDAGAGSLRQAILDVCPGGTIDFTNTLHGQAIGLSSGQLTIGKNLTILGPGPASLAVMRSTAPGTPDFRIFVISNGVTANISGLTIANGSVVSGSGFSMDGVSLAYEATGGGLCNMGTLVLSNSVLSGNRAYASAGVGFTVAIDVAGPTYEAAGGGIYNAPGANLTVINCTVSNNAAIASGTVTNTIYLAYGGGIANDNATLRVLGSTLSGNTAGATNNGTATATGGGISSENGGTVFVENSTLSGNRANALAVFNNTLVAAGGFTPAITPVSAANADGGGLWNNGSAVALASVTVASNGVFAMAVDNYVCSGGGLFNMAGPGTVRLTNSIVAGNSGSPGPDWLGAFLSGGFNLIGNTNGGSGLVASDLINPNALLGPLASNGGPTLTHALLSGSPARDAGNPSIMNAPAFDQRGAGFPRIVNARIDIGAFEVQSFAPMIACPSNISTTNDLGQCSASVLFTNTVTGVPTPDVVCLLSNSVITSPHAFAVGTNLVTCTATNVAGTNGCMFTVIVRDAQAPVLVGVPASTTNQCLSAAVLLPSAALQVVRCGGWGDGDR